MYIYSYICIVDFYRFGLRGGASGVFRWTTCSCLLAIKG